MSVIASPSGSKDSFLVFPAKSEPSGLDLTKLLEALPTLDQALTPGGDLREKLRSLGLVQSPLFGQKVLVTGSARQEYPKTSDGRTLFGIGDAVAEGMLQNGASVILNSFTANMSQERLDALRSGLSQDQKCEYLCGDMSTWSGAQKLVRDAYELSGGLDTLVLNAGTFIEPSFMEMTEDHLVRTMNLNHKGPIAAIQEFVRLKGKDQEGRIIITTSINARLGEPGHVAYDASKAALEASMRSIVLDLAKDGYSKILINAVAPGLIYTPLTHDPITADPAEHARLQGVIPMQIGWPEDLAQHYVNLANPNCRYINGAVIDVSGGLAVRQAT